MAIRFSVQDISFGDYDEDRLRRWIAEVVMRRGKQVGNINYLFCSDEYLLSINQQFLNHDTYTDIITFDYVHGSLISGDILISIERVEENSLLYDASIEKELRRVVIHGVLHLLGQGDKTEEEAKQMRALEAEALEVYEQLFPVEQES